MVLQATLYPSSPSLFSLKGTSWLPAVTPRTATPTQPQQPHDGTSRPAFHVPTVPRWTSSLTSHAKSATCGSPRVTTTPAKQSGSHQTTGTSKHGRPDADEPPQRDGRHGPTELWWWNEASSQLHGARNARDEHGSWRSRLAQSQRKLNSLFLLISWKLCVHGNMRYEKFATLGFPNPCGLMNYNLHVSVWSIVTFGGFVEFNLKPGLTVSFSPDSTNSSENIYTMMNPIGPGGNRPNFPMGPGPDGPMGGMGSMEPHHMNGSLGSNDMDGLPKNSPNNMAGMNNPPGTPRDDGEMAGNFLNPFQSESYSPNMTMSV
ncbi:unnamed protein product [Oncorhynchus mykiss]|uniref:Uncharacterized protein n=1 Tax=Oncorhynchus mykiss TaxID=8022 RepID=A0A060VWC9_ONCMY|nr:unnamed protein product [Oncorhynchus mykiss]